MYCHLYCHSDCSHWDDNDHGLGCYGWCKLKNIPITSEIVYRAKSLCEFYDGTREG
jgi:hypothetical protein